MSPLDNNQFIVLLLTKYLGLVHKLRNSIFGILDSNFNKILSLTKKKSFQKLCRYTKKFNIKFSLKGIQLLIQRH